MEMEEKMNLKFEHIALFGTDVKHSALQVRYVNSCCSMCMCC